MRTDQIAGDTRYRRFSGMNPCLRAITFITVMVLFMSAFLTACLGDSDDEPVLLADYGHHGASFARELAARYPGRSPGSVSERAAGDMIIRYLQDLGYEPVIETFHFETEVETETESEDSDTEAANDEIMMMRYYSRNIIVRIPGTGFISEDDEVISRQIIIGAHYDTAIGTEQITPVAEDPETDDPAAEDPETDEPDTEDPDEQDSQQDLQDEDMFESELVFEDLEHNWYLYDGIHDNASGIGVLMTLARILRQETLAYDVVLVAFGAGEANMAGSRDFASRMSPDEIEQTDAMYEINAVYAGDKVYAHAGWNSLVGEDQKDYDMRRKLYELTDVFYEHELYTNNRFMLYTNQSSFFTALPVEEAEDVTETEPEAPDEALEEEAPDADESDTDEILEDTDESAAITRPQPAKFIYREWTVRESDYRSFDKLGIPIVYFDSGDYNINELADFRESNSPAFSDTGGMISQTAFDSTTVLSFVFDEPEQDEQTTFDEYQESIPEEAGVSDVDQTPEQIDQLRQRINNISFLILEAAKKGTHLIDQDYTDEGPDGLLSASEN